MIVGWNEEIARGGGHCLEPGQRARVAALDHHDPLEIARAAPARARITLDAHDRDPTPAERAHDREGPRMLDAEHEGPGLHGGRGAVDSRHHGEDHVTVA